MSQALETAHTVQPIHSNATLRFVTDLPPLSSRTVFYLLEKVAGRAGGVHAAAIVDGQSVSTDDRLASWVAPAPVVLPPQASAEALPPPASTRRPSTGLKLSFFLPLVPAVVFSLLILLTCPFKVAALLRTRLR